MSLLILAYFFTFSKHSFFQYFFSFFFFKQKTAYEIGTGDWSSDVCSSDLLTIFCCWLVGISSLPIGRNLGPEQKPVGLKKVDLIKSILGVHLPGVVIGTLAGYGLLGGSITLDFLNDYFVGLAILVLIFVLCKSCPIYQYFASSGNDQGPCMYRQSDELHTCFKLLVRDFAGQMLYHPLHQPFLPRYGLFVCTFSWKKAERYSLRFAENPEHGDRKSVV